MQGERCWWQALGSPDAALICEALHMAASAHRHITAWKQRWMLDLRERRLLQRGYVGGGALGGADAAVISDE